MACNPDKIRAALLEQAKLVTDITTERIETSDRMALRMVPDGGVVERNSNQDSVIYGEAIQAPTKYRALDHAVRPLVAGDMEGRTLAGTNGLFTVDINDIDDNACHGACEIDFSQGFRRRGTVDFGLDLETPVKCVRDFDRLDEAAIMGYFDGFERHFTRYGYDNFSDNLLNLLILNSEANSSVISATSFGFTAGGWEAPPLYRVSIFHLQEYALRIKAEMRGRGMDVSDNWMLEVEMPVEDWIEAVRADQLARNPSTTTYADIKYLVDAEGPMRGRRYDTYGGIKAYFTESPIRGYFKQTGVVSGQPTYNFVRVYEWQNEEGEVGGLVLRANHYYREDSIVVDGVTYPMVMLIPHIDPRSFRRWRLEKPMKPMGGQNDGVNYNVKVVDGAYIPCNDHDDKFKLTARHEFRFGSQYPEISGFIAARVGRRGGYVIEVTPRDLTPAGPARAFGEDYRACAADPCAVAECAQCGQVPDQNLQCVAAGAPGGVLNLLPCGNLDTYFTGSAYPLQLRVRRTGDPSQAASVTWTSAHVTTNDTDFLDGTGTLNWAAQDVEDKIITINILATAVAATPQTFTVTLTSPTGDTLGTCTVATVTLHDES